MATTLFSGDMPFSPRLVALLRDPTSWEGLKRAQRKRVIADFMETQAAAVSEHDECRKRLNIFFDHVYSVATVSPPTRVRCLGWPVR